MRPPREAFTGLASLYSKARPDYPVEAIEWVLARRPFAPGDLMVDVASGTGILTRALQRSDRVGLRLVGVEPNPDMRSQAQDGLEYLEGAAEALPFADGEVSALTCGQALHWFDRPAFYREALRVLRPDGFLAVLDNNRDHRSDAFMQAYESLLEVLSEGAYRRNYRALDHRREFLEAGFGRVEEARFPWKREMTREGFLDLAFSSSKVQGVAAVAGEERLRAEILALIPGPEVVVPYLTEVRIACPK